MLANTILMDNIYGLFWLADKQIIAAGFDGHLPVVVCRY